MKNHKYFLALSLCFIVCTSSLAQDIIRQEPCYNDYIQKQVDSIKEVSISAGFVVVKEAGIRMESEYEMPVIVPLSQGTWYQVVFIADPNSRLAEVRMFDWNEKQLVYQKKQPGEIDNNIISYNYIPKFTEYHMIKPVQINKKKKKSVCGYIMLLKKLKK